MVLITIVNGVYKPTYNWQHHWQPSFQCELGDQKNKLSARTPVIRKSFTTTPLTNSCSLLAGFGPGWRIMKIFEDLTWEEFHAGYRTVRETRSRCLFPMFLPDRPWKYWMFFWCCSWFWHVFYCNDVKFPKTYSIPQTLDDDAQSNLMAQLPARILGNASQNGLKGFVFQ